MEIQDKQLRSIRLSDDHEIVTIKWDEIRTVEPESEEDKSQEKTNKHSCRGTIRPHKDLVDTMKKLRKFALELLEIEYDSKSINGWIVTQVTIAGDVDHEKSRVVITLGKKVNRTASVKEIDTPQAVMFPKEDDLKPYADTDKMTAVLLDLIEESWSYLNGKYEEGISDQLPLFPMTAEV